MPYPHMHVYSAQLANYFSSLPVALVNTLTVLCLLVLRFYAVPP